MSRRQTGFDFNAYKKAYESQDIKAWVSFYAKDAEWIARQGEKFYVSIGYDSLPQSFWEKSSFYPVPKDAG